jgi:hypothetical protein
VGGADLQGVKPAPVTGVIGARGKVVDEMPANIWTPGEDAEAGVAAGYGASLVQEVAGEREAKDGNDDPPCYSF